MQPIAVAHTLCVSHAKVQGPQINMKKDDLKNRLAEKCGCSIQHTGWPCNTCFHAMEIPGLKEHIHDYWEAVLAIRGDYDDIDPNPELIDELYAKLDSSCVWNSRWGA